MACYAKLGFGVGNFSPQPRAILGLQRSGQFCADNHHVFWRMCIGNELEQVGVVATQFHELRAHAIGDHLCHALNIGAIFHQEIERTGGGRRDGEATFATGFAGRALGGGGHDHSAAAIIKGSLDTVIKETVEKLHEMLLITEAKEAIEPKEV